MPRATTRAITARAQSQPGTFFVSGSRRWGPPGPAGPPGPYPAGPPGPYPPGPPGPYPPLRGPPGPPPGP
ncbi:MAG TPA: hypothetical protein DEW39_15855 [Brevibacterium sp.]|nr:hypothetical protein [Brevibacterium sp.]